MLPEWCYTVADMGETLTIRLGQQLAFALEEEARRTGLAKGEIARKALEAQLKSTGKLSVMERHFGSMTGPRISAQTNVTAGAGRSAREDHSGRRPIDCRAQQTRQIPSLGSRDAAAIWTAIFLLP
jgi:hypothetical protein